MYYIDTSVLVAYYCPEPISEAVERSLRRIERPAISSLTEVELVSAIARKVRDRSLKKKMGIELSINTNSTGKTLFLNGYHLAKPIFRPHLTFSPDLAPH